MAAVDLAAALRGARLRRQLTQEQVGRLLHPPIGHSLISRYESGVRPPDSTLLQLAKLLNLNVTLIDRDVEAMAS